MLERFYHAIPIVKAMEKCSSLVLVKAHSSPTNSDSHSDPQHSTANTPNFRAVDGVCSTPVALLHSSARESPLHDPCHTGGIRKQSASAVTSTVPLVIVSWFPLALCGILSMWPWGLAGSNKHHILLSSIHVAELIPSQREYLRHHGNWKR